MSVVRVWGRVDGSDVIFTHSSCPNIWTVNVPYDADGEYLCEIWCESSNGKISFRTAILYITDGRVTTLKYISSYVLEYITMNKYTLELSNQVTRSLPCPV